jgi:(p)ppGpp synthase/HD superfamily hydrolase
MSTLERAIAIAAEGHSGAKDKGGEPYILHPLRMMLSLSSTEERIVAVLHDVCEDCPGWTLDRLRAEGFPDHIIAALDSVTPPIGCALFESANRKFHSENRYSGTSRTKTCTDCRETVQELVLMAVLGVSAMGQKRT